jgi:hypothetical protein
MKLCSLSVGKSFCEKYSQRVKEYAPADIDLIILTDHPEYFDSFETVPYLEKTFSYFSKNTFVSEMCKNYKSDILYIDIDTFGIVDSSIFKKQFSTTYFLYDRLWEEYPYSEINSLPKDLLDYYGISGNIKIENFHENIFYLPYSNKIEKLHKDLVSVKKIWDSYTISKKPKGNEKKYSKYGVGYGEGIPFSLSLLMNGIQTMKYRLRKQKTTI